MISEEGIRAIVTEKTGVTPDLIELVGIHVSGGNREIPVAVDTVQRNGDTLEVESDGDGMVNAAFGALQRVFDIPAVLLDYRVSPLTSGADAMAEVNVIIQVGSDTYSGRGVSTDVVEGSARAFTAALNKAAVARTAITPSEGTD